MQKYKNSLFGASIERKRTYKADRIISERNHNEGERLYKTHSGITGGCHGMD